MITHFFDTPYSSNCNVCTISPGVEASEGFDCPGFIQPNKQANKQKSGEISDELYLKLGPQMHVSAKSQSEGTIQYVPEF